MMDAKARLDGVREKLRAKALERASVRPGGNPVLSVNDAMEVLTAAGVTLPEPEPPGPVVSHEAINALARLHGYTGCDNASHYRLCPSCQATAREVQDGLLTPAEVERRAREWWSSHYGRPVLNGVPDSLVAALTREAK